MHDGVIGLAGQFIAAVLETAGLFGQSQVLTNFSNMFQSLGALLYTWFVIGGLISLAVFGDYKKALYFFIAPALFWWLITDTVSLTDESVVHQFGTRIHDSHRQKKALKRMGNREMHTDASGAKVSKFFAKYDRLVSSTIQQLVAFLIDTDRNEDLIRVARERVYTRLFTQRGKNKHYISLLSLGLIGRCSDYVTLRYGARSNALLNASRGLRPDASQEDLDRYGIDTNSDEYQAYLRRVEKAKQLKAKSIELPEKLHAYVKALGFDPQEEITCGKVWKYIQKATIDKAEEMLKAPTEEQKKEFPELSDVEWERAYQAIIKKLKPKNSSDVTDGDRKKAAEVLAAFILKNSIGHTAHGAMAMQIRQRGNWDEHLKQTIYGDKQASLGAAQRQTGVYLIAAIPYLQGVLLYLLSFSFPFFCLMVLVPGRTSSIVVWLSLWLWVKSWDLGAAMIHFVRQLLWDMMPNATEVRIGSNTTADFYNLDWDAEGSVMNLIYINDPAAHHGTYYTIIVVLTMATPVITGYFCLGAANVWNAFSMGISQTADQYFNQKEKGAVRSIVTDSEGTQRPAAARVGSDLSDIESGTVQYQDGNKTREYDRAVSGFAEAARWKGAVAGSNAFKFQYSDAQKKIKQYIATMTHRQQDIANPNVQDLANPDTIRLREQTEGSAYINTGNSFTTSILAGEGGNSGRPSVKSTGVGPPSATESGMEEGDSVGVSMNAPDGIDGEQ